MPPLLPPLLTQAVGEPAMRREADVMGLTVCVALLAALVAGNDHAPHSKFDLIVVVWATTVGLVLTHAFAQTLAVRLVKDPAFTIRPLALLSIQLGMATLVALTTSVVALVTSSDYDRLGARTSAAVFLGLIVGVEMRNNGSTRGRAAAWGVGAMAGGLALATGKWLIGS